MSFTLSFPLINPPSISSYFWFTSGVVPVSICCRICSMVAALVPFRSATETFVLACTKWFVAVTTRGATGALVAVFAPNAMDATFSRGNVTLPSTSLSKTMVLELSERILPA